MATENRKNAYPQMLESHEDFSISVACVALTGTKFNWDRRYMHYLKYRPHKTNNTLRGNFSAEYP